MPCDLNKSHEELILCHFLPLFSRVLLNTSWLEFLVNYHSSQVVCLQNRSTIAVNLCVIIHRVEVSCKEAQIMSVQRV